jgi:hypothetical protein
MESGMTSDAQENPTRFTPLRTRKSNERRRAESTLWIAGVVALLLTLFAATAPGPWKALSDFISAEPRPTLEHCSTVIDMARRLACYDQAAAQNQAPPAKGGIAPPLFQSGERSQP